MGRSERDLATEGTEGISFVLVQLGFHVASMFTAQLAPLGLEPRQFGVLSRLAANEGRSQQAIGQLIGLNATRMVFLVDELEQLGLAERRRNQADRRSHALYLTDKGREMLAAGQQAAAAFERRLGDPLTATEVRELASLLRRLADAWHIAPDSMPGTLPVFES